MVKDLIRVAGPSEAKLMIVGDYPTKEEYAQGLAYSGPTGSFIDSLLKPHDYSIKKCFCTYLYKVPIPGWESKKRKNKQIALEKVKDIAPFEQYLQEEIETIQPNVILSLGELSLNYLTGHKGVDKRRGSIYPILPTITKREIKVVPILSPRDIWRQNEKPHSYTVFDVGKAVKLIPYTKAYQLNLNIWFPRNSQELYNWWARVRTSNTSHLTVDIETHFGFITCLGFCHDGKEAISIPLLLGMLKDYEEQGRVYSLIAEILRSPIPKVNQNILYDITLLERWGIKTNNIIGDTMLLAGVIYPELPKDLGFLNSLYTDIPYYKDEGRDYDPRIHRPEKLLRYNALDCLSTWRIWDEQLKDAAQMGVKKFYFHYIMPTAFYTYKKMSEHGIRRDETQRLKLLHKYVPLREECQQFITEGVGQHINPNSPKQVAHLVYDILDCPKQYTVNEDGEKTLTTGEEELEEIYINKLAEGDGRREILKQALLYRKIDKVITFLNAPISADGRARMTPKIAGTKSGRTSNGKSLDYIYIKKSEKKINYVQTGFSFQTIPKHGFEFGTQRIGEDLRSIFVPSPGYVFVGGDGSQAEARVVCVLAEDYDTLKLFDETDIHIVTATWVLGKKYEDITKQDRQDYGKKPRHAGNYNMGPGRLSQMTHKPESETRIILVKFHDASPKIRGVFHAGIRREITQSRCLVSPHGRRRDFFGRVTEDMFKEGFSQVPQATVSDHFKFTVLNTINSKWDAPLIYPFAEGHDSLDFEVKAECRESFTRDLQAAIETPISFREGTFIRDFDLIIPGEVEFSEFNWKDMIKI